MPRTTLKGLSAIMNKIADKLPEEVSKLAVNVGMTVEKDLTDKTPVDTSKAISNWQVRLNNPTAATIPPYVAGMQGSTKEQSAAVAVSVAAATLRGKKSGTPIYISNVLDYISKLNDGSSSQQPAGFVERAVLLGRIEVKKARFELV